jgi:hypothetical protein
MKKLLVMATALVAGLAVGLAQAEDEKGKGKGKGKGDPAKRAEFMLKALDKDDSKTISKEEFAAGKMGQRLKEKGGDGALDKVFGNLDKNDDGELDKAELSAPGKGGKGKPPKGKGKGKGKDGKGKEKEDS